KIITTAVNGETPTHPVTIQSATVFTDTVNNVIKLSPKSGFTGSANIQVTASDGVGAPDQKSFTLTPATYTANDAAFLGQVGNHPTTAGHSVSFPLPFPNREPSATTPFGVGTPGSPPAPGDIPNAPASVTVGIDQATGKVTLTPVAGFTGSV